MFFYLIPKVKLEKCWPLTLRMWEVISLLVSLVKWNLQIMPCCVILWLNLIDVCEYLLCPLLIGGGTGWFHIFVLLAILTLNGGIHLLNIWFHFFCQVRHNTFLKNVEGKAVKCSHNENIYLRQWYASYLDIIVLECSPNTMLCAINTHHHIWFVNALAF